MKMTKETRKTLIFIAVVALIAATVIALTMGNTDEFKRIADMLNTYGYSLTASDIAAVGGTKDTTIIQMLGDEAASFDEAVEASKAMGFPSDPNRHGDITLLATQPSENEVILIFMCGEEIEMCFSQSPDGSAVFPIGGGDKAK